MPFTENLSPFFADYGDDGTLAGLPVRGIFDRPHALEMQGGLGGPAGISATEPIFLLASASVPASAFGALLVLPQGSFKVRAAEPDGTGLTTLRLTVA